jgi:hypothetical protein
LVTGNDGRAFLEAIVSSSVVAFFAVTSPMALIIEKSGQVSFSLVGVEVPFLTTYVLWGRAYPLAILSSIHSTLTQKIFELDLAALYF